MGRRRPPHELGFRDSQAVASAGRVRAQERRARTARRSAAPDGCRAEPAEQLPRAGSPLDAAPSCVGRKSRGGCAA
jgi:uncharacterized metal-binding protein